MTKRYVQRLIGVIVFFVCVLNAFAHCEVPCGIYDDSARIKRLSEHITTIEKAMTEILKLKNAKDLNYNQIIRWTMTKEKHATKIQNIVSQYFMTQRIKTTSDNYKKKLAALHEMLVMAMKCKQTTDLVYPESLRRLVKEFADIYFEKAK
jgi:nickel superoxide dismutase